MVWHLNTDPAFIVGEGGSIAIVSSGELEEFLFYWWIDKRLNNNLLPKKINKLVVVSDEDIRWLRENIKENNLDSLIIVGQGGLFTAAKYLGDLRRNLCIDPKNIYIAPIKRKKDKGTITYINNITGEEYKGELLTLDGVIKDSSILKGKRIGIFDDFITTGGTMKELIKYYELYTRNILIYTIVALKNSSILGKYKVYTIYLHRGA